MQTVKRSLSAVSQTSFVINFDWQNNYLESKHMFEMNCVGKSGRRSRCFTKKVKRVFDEMHCSFWKETVQLEVDFRVWNHLGIASNIRNLLTELKKLMKSIKICFHLFDLINPFINWILAVIFMETTDLTEHQERKRKLGMKLNVFPLLVKVTLNLC